MGTFAPCRHSLLPGVALSQPCGCAQAPGRQPKGHDAARLPRSIAPSPALSLWSPQSVPLSSYFCLQKALNRLVGKDELCQSLHSDASQINCRDWLHRCCKGREGPGLTWKSWGPVGLPSGDPFSWEGPMESESKQNSPDAAQRQCWTLCFGTPVLTSVAYNSSELTGLLLQDSKGRWQK